MQYDAHCVPQGGQLVLPHIPASHQNLALGGVVQPGNQLDQGAFSRSSTPDDSHCLSGGNTKIYMEKGVLLSGGTIAEGHIPELNGTIRHEGNRVGGVG